MCGDVDLRDNLKILMAFCLERVIINFTIMTISQKKYLNDLEAAYWELLLGHPHVILLAIVHLFLKRQ